MPSAFDETDFNTLLDTLERYIKERLIPLENTVEQTESVPDAIVDEMRDMGLFGLTIPQAYGGFELSVVQETRLHMLMSTTSQAFCLVFWPNVGIGSRGIINGGTDEQKQRYLPKLASGEWRAAFCLTEPDAGSDAASLRTSARADGDHYLLSGSKRFITNASCADIFTVMARTDPDSRGAEGISAFIVEKNTPGLHIGKPEHKLGQRGAPICDVIFDDVRVPASSLIGGEAGRGQGFKIAMQVLDSGRIGVAGAAVGMMRRMIDEAARYALSRKQFGQPIAQFQLVQGMLADCETDCLAGHSLVMDAARCLEAGRDTRILAAAAKYFCSEAVGRVADRALQIFGGSGYIAEYPIERMWRDARVLRIYEGTSQIQQLVIAKNMLRRYT